MKRIPGLSEDDRVLWNIVARTVKPLKSAAAPVSLEPVKQAAPEPPAAKPSLLAAVAPKPAPRRPPPPTHLDAPTQEKLAKGRLPIEGRVDLHGLFQDEAYALLLSFLSRAYASGARHVLVITGKGSSSGGDGVLRRAVPSWLATTPFRDLVSGFDHAARGHGGSGALYVRLKRRS